MCEFFDVYFCFRWKYKDLLLYQENPLSDLLPRYYRTLASVHRQEGSLYSWQKTFPSSSPPEVEEQLAGLGYTTEWTAHGALR